MFIGRVPQGDGEPFADQKDRERITIDDVVDEDEDNPCACPGCSASPPTRCWRVAEV